MKDIEDSMEVIDLKCIKIILPVILGIAAGYELTSQFFSELIPVLIGTQGFIYPLVLYSTLTFTILFFTIIFQVIIAKKISKPFFCCLMLTYFIIWFAALFYRCYYESYFIVNPLISFLDSVSNWEMFMQSILNVFLFFPLGYFVRGKNILTTIIFSVVISLMVEAAQYIFKLGFFDTFDCLLYTAGICLGRLVFRKIPLIFNKL